MKTIRTLLSLTILLFAISFSINGQTKDWAKFSRYAEKNTTQAGKVDVVFMGDSNTEIWYRDHPAFFDNNNFAARGISGQTTAEMLCRFRPDVIELAPKIVVFCGGTNDVAQNLGYISVENIMDNIESMYQLAKHNKIDFVIISIHPSAGFSWRKEMDPVPMIQECNARLQEFAKANKIPFIDSYSKFADESYAFPKPYSYDGVHFTSYGFTFLEDMVIEVLAKELKKKKGDFYKSPSEQPAVL